MAFAAFGLTAAALVIVLLVPALLVSLLINVVFLISARLEEEKPRQIAFLSPSSGGQPFYTALLNGLVRSASLALGQDYIILPSMPTTSFESMSIWALFAGLEDRQVDIDGIFFIPDDPDWHFEEIVGFHEERGDVPLVLIDVYFNLAACDARTRARLPSFVGGDELAGGRIAGDIVIEAIGDYAPEQPMIMVINGGAAPWEQQRAVALRKRLEEQWSRVRFVESPPINYSRHEAFNYTYDQVKAMADESRSVDLHAVFACNDDMAIGARAALTTLANDGYTFPHTPQIVGYDGISEIKEYINAKDIYLAGTVDVKVEDQARAAMLLMHRLVRSGERRAEVQLIAPEPLRRPR
ncbi:hypothetical protein CIK06_18820 [Plantactinospora sp. KBS50]|nr:hypothetical protein CIK06_18820 [Plantactinospora sp. KBS50]